MEFSRRHSILIAALLVTFLCAFLLNMSVGSVHIPVADTFRILTGGEAAKPSWEYILLSYRLPKALVAILVGLALPVSGLLMQTLFRNPMAEPYVLGLSSGSSLGVALVILGGSLFPAAVQHYFSSPFSISIASVSGSFIVLLVVLLVLQKVKDTMTLLVIGLMFSSFSGALVSVLTYFSSAEELQRFTFWAMGSLGNQTWTAIHIMMAGIIIGLLISIVTLKPLNAFLLGEKYAHSLGVPIVKIRYFIITATALLAGTATAFAGPIAFVGLAIPHITRITFKTSNHVVLFTGNLLIGSTVLLISDTLSQVPGASFVLPINAVTSILGAPVVIAILLKKRLV